MAGQVDRQRKDLNMLDGILYGIYEKWTALSNAAKLCILFGAMALFICQLCWYGAQSPLGMY